MLYAYHNNCGHRFTSCNGENYNPLAGQLATNGQHSLWRDDDALPLTEMILSQPYLLFLCDNQSNKGQFSHSETEY